MWHAYAIRFGACPNPNQEPGGGVAYLRFVVEVKQGHREQLLILRDLHRTLTPLPLNTLEHTRGG
jgi:hypothetical protein